MAEKHNPTDAVRGATEAVRQAAQAGADVSRQAAEGAAGRFGQTAQQLLQAAEVYSETARRLADEIRALVNMPTSAAGGVQDLTQTWTDWLSRAVDASTRFSQEMMSARSLPQVAEIQSRFVEDTLTGLRESGTRMLEVTGEIAAQAMSPLEGRGAEQEEGEGEGEGEEEPSRTVAEVMSRDVKTASPDDTVQQVAQVMAQSDAGAVPVAENDKLVGMLTDRDIAVRLVAPGKDPANTKVRDVMTAEVKYVYDDEDLDHVAENMGEQRLRRMPVVNRDKRLVGIVSLGDLATGLPEPHLAGEALSGIARAGGPHRQRPVAAHAGGKPKSGGGAGAGAAGKARRQPRRK